MITLKAKEELLSKRERKVILNDNSKKSINLSTCKYSINFPKKHKEKQVFFSINVLAVTINLNVHSDYLLVTK